MVCMIVENRHDDVTCGGNMSRLPISRTEAIFLVLENKVKYTINGWGRTHLFLVDMDPV